MLDFFWCNLLAQSQSSVLWPIHRIRRCPFDTEPASPKKFQTSKEFLCLCSFFRNWQRSQFSNPVASQVFVPFLFPPSHVSYFISLQKKQEEWSSALKVTWSFESFSEPHNPTYTFAFHTLTEQLSRDCCRFCLLHPSLQSSSLSFSFTLTGSLTSISSSAMTEDRNTQLHASFTVSVKNLNMHTNKYDWI